MTYDRLIDAAQMLTRILQHRASRLKVAGADSRTDYNI
jgi:hypothetical protein